MEFNIENYLKIKFLTKKKSKIIIGYFFEKS
jgi:hypothetical protein